MSQAAPSTTWVDDVIAEAVRMERHRRRLKQSDVAEMAGTTQERVSEVEAGRASTRVTRAVAAALGLEVSGGRRP